MRASVLAFTTAADLVLALEILTSNCTFGSWDQAFASEAVLTVAILGRVTRFGVGMRCLICRHTNSKDHWARLMIINHLDPYPIPNSFDPASLQLGNTH